MQVRRTTPWTYGPPLTKASIVDRPDRVMVVRQPFDPEIIGPRYEAFPSTRKRSNDATLTPTQRMIHLSYRQGMFGKLVQPASHTIESRAWQSSVSKSIATPRITVTIRMRTLCHGSPETGRKNARAPTQGSAEGEPKGCRTALRQEVGETNVAAAAEIERVTGP